MKTQRIAIIGIDGTGKSSLVEGLRVRLQASGRQVRACRALQLYTDRDLPLGHLSESLDSLSTLGDELNLPALKGVALFLGMSLYGPAERFITTYLAPEWLISERHPLIDAITYARFYAPLVQHPIDRQYESVILECLTRVGGNATETMQQIEDWIHRLPGLDGDNPGFYALSTALHQLFQLDPLQLLERLKEIFQVELPEHIAWLRTGVDTADARIDVQGDNRRPTRELHEKAEVLTLLQTAYGQTCRFITERAPQTRLMTFDTGELSQGALLDSVLVRAGVPHCSIAS